MKDEIFIVFEYNGRDIAGIESFKEELSHSYLCQGRSKQMSAFSQGGEIWFNVFINIPFNHFVECAVAGGLMWNYVKTDKGSYFLKPLLEALINLEEANKDSTRLKVQAIKFVFDDIEIVLGGITPSLFSVIGSVFDEVSQRKQQIEQLTAQPIIQIETPLLLLHNPIMDEREHFPFVLSNEQDLHPEDYLEMWKIYSPKDHQVYKLSDNSLLGTDLY